MVKLTSTGVKINTNLVWTSHNTGGVEFNTGVFAVLSSTIIDHSHNWSFHVKDRSGTASHPTEHVQSNQ